MRIPAFCAFSVYYRKEQQALDGHDHDNQQSYCRKMLFLLVFESSHKYALFVYSAAQQIILYAFGFRNGLVFPLSAGWHKDQFIARGLFLVFCKLKSRIGPAF